jgi:RNA polymerase sigma-70 factor, ECF subfamily
MNEQKHDNVDAELLRRARGRDADALAALCEQIYPKVLKYMYYRCRPDTADDLTAEVMLRVVRGVERQNGSFWAWLYRIAANVVIDKARSAKSRREETMDEQMLAQRPEVASAPAAVGRHLDIQDAIGQLTDDQKELVVLKFVQGLSNAEIGEATGRTPEAIRALQFRALAALRQILGEGDKE